MAKEAEQDKAFIGKSVDIYINLALITFFAFISFTFVMPFITIILWGMILAISIHPLYVRLTSLFGGSEKLASIVIAVLGLVFLLVPTALLTQSAVDSSKEIIEGLRSGSLLIPPPQETVKDWPLIGEKIFGLWGEAHANLQDAVQQYSAQIKSAATKVVSFGKSTLGGILQFALSIIFASMFLAYTKPLSSTIKKIARRLDGKAGEKFIDMAVVTTRNVSKGVLGIALFQGGLAAVGYFLAGIPFAGLLCVVTICLSLIQLPMLIIIPSIIYVWGAKSALVALIFTVYMIPVMLSDNVLKPIIMAKGLTTPMSVIFIGVIGGTVSLGILGLFIGPVVLAIFYEMVRLWIGEAEE